MSPIDGCLKRKYKVKLRGASAVQYSEGNKRVTVHAEMMSGDIDLILYTSSLTAWETPLNGVKLTDNDKNRIMKNISCDLEMHNILTEWVR